jgi:hypothetical protein
MSGVCEHFALAGGTIPGRAHVLAGRGNQDAIGWRQTPEAIVAVVADGCSSGAHCEVGAQLVVRLLVEALHAQVCADIWPRPQEDAFDEAEIRAIVASLLEAARQQVLSSLQTLVGAFGSSANQAILDLLLCTAIGLLVTPQLAVVFAVGDGLVVVNGEATRLGPFEGNAPPYLAYGLLAGSPESHPDVLRLGIYHLLAAPAVQTILIGTDGVVDLANAAQSPLPGSGEPLGSLAQFWTDDRYLTNPDAIRRRLALANRPEPGHPGLLPDDTTLVVLRRRAEVAVS